MKDSAVQSMMSAYCNVIRAGHRSEFSSLITTRISMKMVLLVVSVVPVVGSCDYGMGHSGCMKGEEFVGRLLAADDDC